MPDTFGSVNEENVYRALVAAKVDFVYQYELKGGTLKRGGQVIDFVVYVPPRPAAVYIQGAYWHTQQTAVEDQLKQADAEQMGYRVVLLSEAETDTLELAKVAVQRKVL